MISLSTIDLIILLLIAVLWLSARTFGSNDTPNEFNSDQNERPPR